MSVRSTLAVLTATDGAAAAGRARVRTSVAAPAANPTTTIPTKTATVILLFFKYSSFQAVGILPDGLNCLQGPVMAA